MAHQATDLARHVSDQLLERGGRALDLLPTTAEKVQLAVAIATNVCGWAAGTVYGLTAPNEAHPPASDLLRWVAGQMDEARKPVPAIQAEPLDLSDHARRYSSKQGSG